MEATSEVGHNPEAGNPEAGIPVAEIIEDKVLTKEETLSKIANIPTTGLIYKAGVWVPRLVLALLLVTAIDLLIFYKNLKSPTFRKVDVFLEPTPDTSVNSDASFAMQGSFTKASLTTAVDSRGAECDFFYRATQHDEYIATGHLSIALPAKSNTVDEFDIQGDMVKVNYEQLRAIYFDVMNKESVESQVKVACDIDVEATFWSVVPFQNTFHIQQELFLEPVRKNAAKSKSVFTYSYDKTVLEEDDDIVSKPGHEYTKHITVESSLKHFSLSLIRYEILIRLNKNFKPDESIKSLVLHVPTISYATAFVDKAGEPKSYLRVDTQPFAVDFAKVPELIDIDMTVSCTPFAVYEGNTKVSSTSTGDCSLVAPFDINRFKYEYKHNGFVNMTTHATHLNFLTRFAGATHYVRTVPQKDADNSNSRALVAKSRDLMMTTDPAISTGSDCVEVDTDGIYFSQACSTVDKGFFFLAVNTYNADGYMGYLSSTTNWATSGPVAFESTLEGSQVDLGDLAARLFFSDNFQNLTLFTTFNYTEGGSFTENLDVAWDLGVSVGELEAKSLTILDGFAPVVVAANLEYADFNYSVGVLVSDKFNQTLGDAATAMGNGRYGGNWNKWWATLDESALYYDHEYEGGAIGAASYDVPSSGTVGDITLMAKATDNVHSDYVVSNFTGGWFSDNSWTSDGNINMDFYLDIVPEALLVNVTSGFHYGDHAYMLGFDMGLDQEPQYVILSGVGGYGGTWSNFHGELLNSTLIYAGDLLGHGRAAMAFIEQNNGGSVGVAGTTLVVDGNLAEVFSSASDLTWYSDSAWPSNGNIAAHSMVSVNQGDGLNWNVTSTVKYTESNYTAYFNGNSVNATTEGIVCDAFGTYLLKYYDWTVALDDLTCYSEGTDLFSVTLFSQIITDGSFDKLRVFYDLDMVDGVGSPVLSSRQSIQAFADPPVVSNVTTLPTITMYAYQNLFGIDYYNYMVNETANNEAIMATMRSCVPYVEEMQFGPFYVMGSLSPTYLYYDVYFPNCPYDAYLISYDISNCFYSGAFLNNMHEYAHAHMNASALLSVYYLEGNAYQSYNGDDDDSYTSPWVYTGHVHIDSFWNMTDFLMWNVTGGLDYSNNTYHAYVWEADENQVTNPTTLYAYGKGGYEGSPLEWTITLDESAFVYNDALIGSATGGIAGLTTSNGMINFTATALDSNDNQVMQTGGQAYWNSEAGYTNDAKMGLYSQLFLSDIMTWNSTAQLEYGQHNYTALFYDSNIYEASDDLILVYAKGEYGGSFPLDFYATVNQGFATYNGVLEANVKARLDVNIADNGTQAVMGFEVYDYSTWEYYQQANAYYLDDAYFATKNTLSYKYDGDVAAGQLSTLVRYDSEPLFQLDSALNVDLLQDAATFSVFESLYGENGLDATAEATYNMDTGMIASMGAVIYYEDKLIYGINTDYDMQLESFNNSDATARPSLMPTHSPTAMPSFQPSHAPTWKPTAKPTAEPTARPSFAPSASPSQQPTFAPSVVPTEAPTQGPTPQPSFAPSFMPTFAPSQVPTEQPSVAPTAAPTTQTPSAAPSTRSPTAIPTLQPSTPPDASVEFVASQVISGISYSSYLENQDANDLALKTSIADCMTGISVDDISSFTVAPARRRLAVVKVKVQDTSTSIQSTYTIVSTDPSLNFDSLSKQLEDSVNSGQFNTYLADNAETIPGASALATCTSSSVTAVSVLPASDNDDQALSGGAIAGIVIAVIFAASLMAAAAYWFFVMKSSPLSVAGDSSSSRSQSRSKSEATVDIEMRPTNSKDSSDPDVKWTENMIRKN